MVVRPRLRVRMPVAGPMRHLVRRSDVVAFGGKAEVARPSQIRRS
jgi:hypothetical protein